MDMQESDIDCVHFNRYSKVRGQCLFIAVSQIPRGIRIVAGEMNSLEEATLSCVRRSQARGCIPIDRRCFPFSEITNLTFVSDCYPYLRDSLDLDLNLCRVSFSAIRPTHARVSMEGTRPLAPSFDTGGTLDIGIRTTFM